MVVTRAAAGLIPGAVRWDCMLSGALVGLVFSTRGSLRAEEPPLQPVGMGPLHQRPLLLPHQFTDG